MARRHAPGAGRLATSQLSNPNTQWLAPSVGITQCHSGRAIGIVEVFRKSSAVLSGAAAACCLGDAVPCARLNAAGMRGCSRVIREGWLSTCPPSAPPFHAAESELSCVLTVSWQPASPCSSVRIRSRGRLLDLTGQHTNSDEHARASGTASRGAETTSHAPLSYGTLRSPSQDRREGRYRLSRASP